jgi:TfoX/Sxy family transcriptional regulator of competence genes
MSTKKNVSMPIDEKLADRIRERFADLPHVEEKAMMGGLTFMYNDKMCVGIFRGDLMCRIDPEVYEEALEKQGCHAMEFKGRVMPGFVLIDATGRHTKKQFDYWIDLALDFNKKAKSSKSSKSGKPSRPSKPTVPSTPTKPSKPTTSSTPSKPSKPSKKRR